MPVYTNLTNKNNTSTLTLNVSVTDAGSGFTYGACIVDVNGTNQTVAVSSGWCNTTVINLTNLADGNQTIKVYVNDSANNLFLNNSFVVRADSTAPTLTFSCSPASASVGETITCTCSGTDTNSGVNTSTLTYTVNPSSQNTGEYTKTCTEADNAGNTASSNSVYNVVGGNSGSTSGSSIVVNFWTAGTQSVSDSDLSSGTTYSLPAKKKLIMTVNGQSHSVGVVSLNSSSAVINVSSTPQQKTMSIGDEWKVNVDSDSYYDLLVKLNSITGNNANVSVKKINETIPGAQQTTQPTTTDSGTDVDVASEEKVGYPRLSVWIIGIIVVLVLIIAGYKLFNRK